MAQELVGYTGGIRSLSQLLKEHGGAINADLMARGWSRRDIGRRLSWGDFKDFIQWLPLTGESALYRSNKPQSWWVTPEYMAIKQLQYVLELANWQRGGGRKSGSPKPKPPKFPVDHEVSIKDPETLALRRQQQAAHLKRRRAERARGRR